MGRLSAARHQVSRIGVGGCLLGKCLLDGCLLDRDLLHGCVLDNRLDRVDGRPDNGLAVLALLVDGATLNNGQDAALRATGRTGRGPLGRLAGRDALGVHLVNLLERQALCLIDEKVDKGDADKAAAKPHKEDLGLQVGVARAVVDQVRGGVGNSPVEQPVGGRGHGQGARAVLQREDFAGDDPAEGAPGRGKEEDVDTDKGDAGLLGGKIVHENVAENILAGGGGAEHGNDELADAHADGAAQKQGATAPALNSPETRQRGDNVDTGGDHLDDERVVDARVGKVLGAVVEYKVDAGQLLQGLEGHAGELALAHAATEAVYDG